jgi:MFS family permease
MKSRERHLRATAGRSRPGVILALTCAAQFMLILGLVVVNVALPTMQKDLRLSSLDLQWVVIIYGLTFGGFLLLGGRAAGSRRSSGSKTSSVLPPRSSPGSCSGGPNGPRPRLAHRNQRPNPR